MLAQLESRGKSMRQEVTFDVEELSCFDQWGDFRRRKMRLVKFLSSPQICDERAEKKNYKQVQSSSKKISYR